MTRTLWQSIPLAGALLLAVTSLPQARADEIYYPDAGDRWESRAPAAMGMDPDRLTAAVEFARQHEIGWLRDLRAQIEKDVVSEPYPELLGETKERGGPSGMIVRRGYIVAQWGDVDRVEMSFSLTKSYLSTIAGLAFDRGLIKSVNDPVWKYVSDGGFDSPHNTKITWRMLLNQTSEWQGVIWGKPDVADRRRGYSRALEEPGSFWEYNDVRVNRLALALLRIWGKPLPQVLRDEVMDPIGASQSWVWHGYSNSYVKLNGLPVQSVSGGGHWGGGLWASTRDHARFGYLYLRNGRWKHRQIVSDRWVRMATAPADVAPQYGFLFWLNTASRVLPSAPESSFFALGSGGNMIWVDPDHELVVVVRWLDFTQLDAFAKLIQGSIQQ